MSLKVGEVKKATTQDFDIFKQKCLNDDGWKLEYNKDGIAAYQQPSTECSFRLLKGRTKIEVSAGTLFDVVMDSEYRKHWDTSMYEGSEVCYIDSNNDIGYYALKVIPPFQTRDFVTQRSWVDRDSEFMIFNHSIFHQKVPRRKYFVRGTSYLTGYYIHKLGEKSCEITYMSHSDPKGFAPAWIINKACTYIGPRLLQRFIQAALRYEDWKNKNQPDVKPWRYPEQLTTPVLDDLDVITSDPDRQNTLADHNGNVGSEIEVTEEVPMEEPSNTEIELLEAENIREQNTLN